MDCGHQNPPHTSEFPTFSLKSESTEFPLISQSAGFPLIAQSFIDVKENSDVKNNAADPDVKGNVM